MATSENLAALIREISEQHGITISRNDPIAILATVNARLLTDSQQGQAALLDKFKSEIEVISKRWEDESKHKAERILNAALAASKEVMTTMMQESAREITAGLRKEIAGAHGALQRPVASAHRVAALNLLASALTVAAVAAAVVFFLFR